MMISMIEGFSVVDVEVMMVDRCCSLLVSTLPKSEEVLIPIASQRRTNMMGWPMIFLPEGS